LKGAGLDHIASNGQKRFVNRLNYVRTREHEVVITTLERLTAEILGGEVEPLDARPHRAVVYEDALIECFEVG
jgi:hypothetical protein